MNLTHFFMFVSAIALIGIILVNIAIYRRRSEAN